ncbi:MAG TPA: sigma-70 family RNA polymerase sigma factor [Pyrinomonadaceae bacterium]|nr:sigma-70 family RNA polymerase sigma factor [Pyrinomonadaceae bacterium]
MQLSRKPTLSLVSGQHSRSDQIGTLVQWIARGDEASFRLFFEATNGLLFGLLLRILGHTQTAEEVLAELYEEVRRRAAQFGKQNERPLTWLILIAHRRAIERLCCQLTTNSETLRKSRGKTTSSINITEQRRLVRAALNAIPPLQHRMIELAFFSGMTNLEIAKEVGQSPAAVESGIRYAMLQLFGLFKSMGFTVEPAKPTLEEV